MSAAAPATAARRPAGPKVRQAVVIIHGMGQHRPLDTLNGFIAAGLPNVEGLKLAKQYYSRPDELTDSYEARRYLAPRQPPRPTAKKPEVYAQTEFFEYHWAHLMQGNRLGDLVPAMGGCCYAGRAPCPTACGWCGERSPTTTSPLTAT